MGGFYYTTIGSYFLEGISEVLLVSEGGHVDGVTLLVGVVAVTALTFLESSSAAFSVSLGSQVLLYASSFEE